MPESAATPELQALLFEQLAAPVVAINRDGCVVTANRACRDLVDASKELVGQPFWEVLCDQGCVERARGQLTTLLDGGDPQAVELPLMDAHGVARAFVWRWSVLSEPSAGAVRSVGIGTDVTGEKCNRERAEAAMKRSEARNRALLQALPDLVFRLDVDGQCLEVYAANENLLYVPPDEIVGQSLPSVLPEPLATECATCIRKALETGQMQSIEYCLPVAPGHRYFEARHVALGDEVLSIIRDITDRRIAEEALRQSERQYRMLMERASDAIVTADATGTLLSVNRAAERLVGRQESELLGMTVAELVSEQLSAAVPELLSRLRSGESIRLEHSLKHRDGQIVDVEVNTKLMPDGTIQGIARDVTERNRAEQALRKSEQSFRMLIERSPNVIVVHREGAIVWVNEACSRMFGYPAEAMLGMDVLDLIHPDDRPLVIERIRRQRETGQAVPAQEERYLRSDGSVGYGEVVAIPLDFQGEPSTIVIAHDITQRKRAEAERRALDTRIQHAQKLESLGVLAGGIAHDFNNLLMGVLGNASLALLDLAPESPARQSVRRIETAAHRAAELTKQLLAYSGKGRFIVEPLDLSKVVEEMVHLLEAVISKKAELRLEFAPDLPHVDADATQLRQVVMNLITNASDALDDRSGVISVRTGVSQLDDEYLSTTYLAEKLEPGEYVFVEVSDTGCGMNAETVDRMFDPFYTTKFTGRGLGLAAVLGIVRGHHGAIQVDSAQGEGTRFCVLLPSTGPSPIPQAVKNAVIDDWRGDGSILVVDDEETVRTVARLILERHGFDVLTASDGVEAIETFKARQRDVRLVVLDMTMPKMSGEQVYRALRSLRPDVPILLSSGYTEREAVNKLAERGLAGFIQKPYAPNDLIASIRRVLTAR